MQTFTFEIDRNCTIWFREYHEIQAENIDDAKTIILNREKENNLDLSFTYQEQLDDTIIDTGHYEISINGETILSTIF